MGDEPPNLKFFAYQAEPTCFFTICPNETIDQDSYEGCEQFEAVPVETEAEKMQYMRDEESLTVKEVDRWVCNRQLGEKLSDQGHNMSQKGLYDTFKKVVWFPSCGEDAPECKLISEKLCPNSACPTSTPLDEDASGVSPEEEEVVEPVKCEVTPPCQPETDSSTLHLDKVRGYTSKVLARAKNWLLGKNVTEEWSKEGKKLYLAYVSEVAEKGLGDFQGSVGVETLRKANVLGKGVSRVEEKLEEMAEFQWEFAVAISFPTVIGFIAAIVLLATCVVKTKDFCCKKASERLSRWKQQKLDEKEDEENQKAMVIDIRVQKMKQKQKEAWDSGRESKPTNHKTPERALKSPKRISFPANDIFKRNKIQAKEKKEENQVQLEPLLIKKQEAQQIKRDIPSYDDVKRRDFENAIEKVRNAKPLKPKKYELVELAECHANSSSLDCNNWPDPPPFPNEEMTD